jgi:adenylyltransferase/sulfurtransferase
MLTQDELERYDRQIILDGFGKEGQEKLKQARVVIAGGGGLGSASSTYLAAAGVGTIRIIDYDCVELSNLNRQILHWDKDIGTGKVLSASTKLKQLNPHIKIEPMNETINETSASCLVAGFDVIIDAMDNLTTRYALNRAAIENNIPFIHGAVHGFEGRVMTIIPGQTACLKCHYRGTDPQGKFPVIGVTPAVIGSIQAAETIKYITGTGTLLTNRLLIFNGLNMKFTELAVNKNPDCEHCGNPAGEE